jgi:ABC-type glycerol-3-phosphate transport system permease component
MISASLKPEAKIFANMNSITTFFPVSASLDNYFEVFRRIDMANVFKNTLVYIGLILIFDLLINSICGYALAKFEFRGKKAVMTLVVALMVMPISKTVYATVFILDFVAHWNDFMWPFLVMTGEDKRTIQLAVQSFFSTSPVHYSAIMASLVVSAIPMIVMFIFMQKYYVEGIASSGIKG